MENGVWRVRHGRNNRCTESCRHTLYDTNHFLAEFHGRWKGLGVAPQDVAEVDVNEVTRLGEEQVIQVPVTHSQ